MRLLLILLLVSYASAKFGRSYRSSDTEVLPAELPVKNDSSATDAVVAVTATTTIRPVKNVMRIETKTEPPTTTDTHHDFEKVIHQRADELKIKTLKSALEHAKSKEHNEKALKVLENSGNDLPDVSDEQTYDEIEEKVEKDLADQYKDEDDYSSAEQLRTSSVSTISNSSHTSNASSAATSTANGSSPTVTTSASPSTIVSSSEASTSKVTTVATEAAKRTTAAKASRRNAAPIQMSVSMRTVGDNDCTNGGDDVTLGKMDIGRRKTTRYPKTTIYETTTKRVIKILRTMKYKKNAAPGTINEMKRNIDNALITFLTFSVLAYSA